MIDVKVNALERSGRRYACRDDRRRGPARSPSARLDTPSAGAPCPAAPDKVPTPDALTVVYSSRVRTLVDAVYDWSRFNSLPRAFGWIRAELGAGRVGARELVRVALSYGDIGTIRRIAALLERQGVGAVLLRKLERALRPSTSLISWNPARPKRGTVDRRWGVVWNDGA